MEIYYTDEEAVGIYKEIIDGKRERFPRMFGSNIELLRPISRYLFEDILNYQIEDIYENLTEKFLINYKLNNIVKEYLGSHYDYIKFVYPDKEIYPWLFKLGARHYLSDENEIKRAIEWLIQKENITIDDVYNGKINRNTIKENKLDSILYKKFSNSISSAFEWYYNNYTNIKFNKEKLLKQKPKYFYEKEFQIELIRNYFKNLGFYENDDSRKNKDLIINNFNRDTLYKICGNRIYKNINRSIFDIFKDCYPNYQIRQWELTVSNTYWKSKINRINAIKDLIDEEGISFNEIPTFFAFDNMKSLKYSKFNNICYKYYNCDYFFWINEAFPNSFDRQDFHKTSYIFDEYKMLSKTEVNLHKLFKRMFEEVLYVEKSNKNYRFFNEIDKESYFPDWILDGNIIVEYFGLYKPENEYSMIKTYTEKVERKVKYYLKLKDYKSLFIYPDDLKNKEVLIEKILSVKNSNL